MWKNILGPDRLQRTIAVRRMCVACWITKATEYQHSTNKMHNILPDIL